MIPVFGKMLMFLRYRTWRAMLTFETEAMAT